MGHDSQWPGSRGTGNNPGSRHAALRQAGGKRSPAIPSPYQWAQTNRAFIQRLLAVSPPPKVNLTEAKTHSTYRQIQQRISKYGIDIEDYIGGDLQVGPTTLDGIKFHFKHQPTSAGNRPLLVQAGSGKHLLNALQSASIGGKPAFASMQNYPGAWWLKLSFAATHGTGLREVLSIERPHLSTAARSGMMPLLQPGLVDRPANTTAEAQKQRSARDRAVFNSEFEQTKVTVRDASALHFAIQSDRCSVHVDRKGFVMQARDGRILLSLNAIQHTVDELLWKTLAEDWSAILPTESITVIMPNSNNQYSRLGLSIRVYQGRQSRLVLKGTMGVRRGADVGYQGCAGTLNLVTHF